TDDTAKTGNSEYFTDIEFRQPAAEARSVIDELNQQEKPDIIIEVRFVQTSMGHLILSALTERIDADFAVVSGGEIRDSIESGNITYKDILKVQPFGNTVVSIDLTGKEVADYERNLS
ncbi:5'-nucleotidase C-terminal domain-containing protein, partial [Shigella sonnei]|uniref:5'-nucleotidase C-terminal domain-containing protein n=1 Tax=Shigella sonnei TaxID=624 RepID=UPI001493AEE6